MSGRSPRWISVKRGTRIGDLPVETVLKFGVDGTPREFIIVQQGLPSDIYDASCDGTWLLMKDNFERHAWNAITSNAYESSTVNDYLNDSFLYLLDSDVQKIIKQVKVPYHKGEGNTGSVLSGGNGLLCKIFQLSGYEVGFTSVINNYIPVAGSVLAYFNGLAAIDEKRIAKYNGNANAWWLRDPYTGDNRKAWQVTTSGGSSSNYVTRDVVCIRPAFILPSNLLLTEEMAA